MRIDTIKSLILTGSLILVGSTAALNQTPSPSPSPTTSTEGYSVTSSIELGVRGLSVNGDHDKYRSRRTFASNR